MFMIEFDKKYLFREDYDILDLNFLYMFLIFIKDRDILLDIDNAVYIYIPDKNIYITIDNIDKILYENDIKFLYSKYYSDIYFIDYFSIDNKLIKSRYIELLVIKLIQLIEYYNNIKSKHIYNYITDIVIMLRIIIKPYRRYTM